MAQVAVLAGNLQLVKRVQSTLFFWHEGSKKIQATSYAKKKEHKEKPTSRIA